MDVAEAIKKRRCIREYSDKEVSWEDLSEILDAGIRAPNAGNLQNWRFVIVDKDSIKEELAKASLNQMWMVPAPYVIVVCSDNTDLKRYYSKRGELLYPAQNCACAIENMMLFATGKGIDSGWVGAFDEHAVRRILKIPDKISPQAIITFGYGQHIPKEPTRRFDLSRVLFFNEWGGLARTTDRGLFPLAMHEGKIKKKGKSFFSKLKDVFKKKEEKTENEKEIEKLVGTELPK